MSIQNLANAPLIDTDIPTAQPFYDGTYPTFAGGAPVSPNVDTTRRFYAGQYGGGIMSMDNVPNGFGVSAAQKGIIAAFNAQNYNGDTILRVAMRKPTTSLKDYTTGWDDLPDLALTLPIGDSNTSFDGGICVASQRQGQYAYVFQHFIRNGIFTNTFFVKVFKVTRDEYVESAGQAGGNQILDGEATDATVPLLSCRQNGQFFVSDEEEPFIWNVYDGIQSGGTANVTGFRDDNSQDIGFQFQSGGVQYISGQSAAYFQRYTLPSGSYGFGPYLVHPWSSGAYNPPELWWVLFEFNSIGETTGRFVIYRSKWKKGQYKTLGSGYQFNDDDDFVNGRIKYPALNPLGYAFEHDVFDDAHKVGVVGPFQELPVYNPRGDVIATFQNTANTTTTRKPLASPLANALGFNFVRDTKRLNMLHVVIADGGSYPTDANILNRIWVANSGDDGANWTRIAQIGPGITPDQQGTPGHSLSIVTRTGIPTRAGLLAQQSVGYDDYLQERSVVGVPPVVRTHDDVLLMGNLTRFTNYSFADGSSPRLHGYPADYGSKISLAVVDYTGLGAASAARDNVFFARSTRAGQIAWQ